MSDGPADDIADTLVEGDSYEQAVLSVRRMVPLSLTTKTRIAIGSLAVSATIAPAVILREDLVRSLEPTAGYNLALGLLALNGIVAAFLGGLLLVRQGYVVRERSLTTEQVRDLVRLEDFLVLIVLLGTLFILVPAALAVLGVVSPGTVETLYGNDIRIYRPDDTLGVDIRLVSATGGLLAAVLAVLQQRLR